MWAVSARQEAESSQPDTPTIRLPACLMMQAIRHRLRVDKRSVLTQSSASTMILSSSVNEIGAVLSGLITTP